MNLLKPLALGLAASLMLAGCAGGVGSRDYRRDQVRSVQQVQSGVVEKVREVNIEGTKTPVGTGAGAVVGGVAGSTVGSGRGSVVGAVVGAVAGGLAGSAVEEGVTRQRGLEILARYAVRQVLGHRSLPAAAIRPPVLRCSWNLADQSARTGAIRRSHSRYWPCSSTSS